MPKSTNPQEVFEAHLTLIERLIRAIAGRHRLDPEEAGDFSGYTFLRMIEDDYAILRNFEGRSRLRTYLTTVVQRLFLDYRVQQWGKWRVSAEARRLGDVGVRLDRLIHRDGYSARQAIESLLAEDGCEASRQELLELADRLPQRGRPRLEGEESLRQIPTAGRVEDLALGRERAATVRKLRAALTAALAELPAEDRLMLKMRFEDGFTVRRIADVLGHERRPLYRRFETNLRTLRTTLETAGVAASDLWEIVGWDGPEPEERRGEPPVERRRAERRMRVSRSGAPPRAARAAS